MSRHGNRIAVLGFVAPIGLAASALAAGEQLWIVQYGTGEDDLARALAPDGAGGAYAGGITYGSLGASNAGSGDAWLARHDGAGDELWLVQIGTNGGDLVTGLAPDGSGGVFAGGWTGGNLGGGGLGWTDAWVARYDDAGVQLWLRQFGTTLWDNVWALAPDAAGGAFVGGHTSGSLGGPNQGNHDAWIARYDGTGEQVWVVQFGTSAIDQLRALAPDGSGGVIAAGHTGGSLGGPHQGLADVWVARYDAGGTQLWIDQVGTQHEESAHAIAPDGAGGAFVGGGTLGDLAGANQGYHDVWLARYDAPGARQWLHQHGAGTDDNLYALTPDGTGGVFAAGAMLAGMADTADTWVGQYDGSGSETWFAHYETTSGEFAYALCGDDQHGFLMAGSSTGDFGGPNSGGLDAWIAHFGAEMDGCPEDLNQDGTVDGADLGLLLGGWGAYGAGDLDGNGTIDGADLGLLLGAWGPCEP